MQEPEYEVRRIRLPRTPLNREGLGHTRHNVSTRAALLARRKHQRKIWMKEAWAVSEENLQRLERLLLEGFGRGDMLVLDETVAEDLIEHQQGLPQGRGRV
jgi:hypothetical protein